MTVQQTGWLAQKMEEIVQTDHGQPHALQRVIGKREFPVALSARVSACMLIDPWARADGYKRRIPAILSPPLGCLIAMGSKGVCVMKPIASAILLAMASFGIQSSPILAQSSSPEAQPQISSASALPEFIPPTGRTKYTLAVRENNATSDAAREAAEALSAKFAGVTTGSISKSEDTVAEASPAPPQRAAQSTEARTIVIASNQSPEEASPKKLARDGAKGNEPIHRIPRAAVAKETRPHFRGASRESLAAIGQKVGFLERLTNPALWTWTTQ